MPVAAGSTSELQSHTAEKSAWYCRTQRAAEMRVNLLLVRTREAAVMATARWPALELSPT